VEAILKTAVAIVDRGGVEALTMRQLGEELGTGTMTVYRHFATKEDLLDAMADLVLSQLSLPSVGDDPLAAISRLAYAMRDAMREHPTVVRLFASRVISSHGALRGGYEAPLAVLRAAGCDGETAVRMYGALLTYTLGFTIYQLPRPWGSQGEEVEIAEQRRRRRAFYESLPILEFPNVIELSGPLTMMASDDQFEWGLQCLLEAFKPHLATTSETSAGRAPG
jgi:AcrR family transcriptional regulator